MMVRSILIALLVIQAFVMINAQYDDETNVNMTEFFDRAATTGCGNGVVDRNRGETCDEGTANGMYGRCCTTNCKSTTFDWTALQTLPYNRRVIGCDANAVAHLGAAQYLYARELFPNLTLYQFDIDRMTFRTTCSGRVWGGARLFFSPIDHDEDCQIDNFSLYTVCDPAIPHTIQTIYIHRRKCPV